MKKLKDKPKTYDGPARLLVDPEKSKEIRKIEQKIKKRLRWKGDEDLEMLSEMFTAALTAPSGIVIEQPTPISPTKPV